MQRHPEEQHVNDVDSPPLGLDARVALARAGVRLASELDADDDIGRFLEHAAHAAANVVACRGTAAVLMTGAGGVQVCGAPESAHEIPWLLRYRGSSPWSSAMANGKTTLMVTADDSNGEFVECMDRAKMVDVGSILAVPIPVPAPPSELTSAIVFVRTAAAEWIADEVGLCELLGEAIEHQLRQHLELAESVRKARQLQQALESRVVIEQAKGMLAGMMGIGVEGAFDVLRSYARSSRRSISDVAQAVLDRELTWHELVGGRRDAGRRT